MNNYMNYIGTQFLISEITELIYFSFMLSLYIPSCLKIILKCL